MHTMGLKGRKSERSLVSDLQFSSYVPSAQAAFSEEGSMKRNSQLVSTWFYYVKSLLV